MKNKEKTMKLRLRWLAALVGVITLLGAAAPAWSAAAEGKFERTLRVTGPVELDVTTGSGGIPPSPGGARRGRAGPAPPRRRGGPPGGRGGAGGGAGARPPPRRPRGGGPRPQPGREGP